MKSSDMKLRSGFFYPLNQILKQLISDTCMYGDLRIFPYYKPIYCLMTVKLISIVGIYNFWSAFFLIHKGSKYTRKEIIIWNIRTLVKIHKGEVMKVLNIYICYTEALGSKFSTIQKCWDQSPYKHVLYGDQVSKTTTAAVDRNSRLVWWRLIFKKNRKETRYM